MKKYTSFYVIILIIVILPGCSYKNNKPNKNSSLDKNYNTKAQIEKTNKDNKTADIKKDYANSVNNTSDKEYEAIKKKFDSAGYQTNYNSATSGYKTNNSDYCNTITLTNTTSIMDRSKIKGIDISLDKYGYFSLEFYNTSAIYNNYPGANMFEPLYVYTIKNGELKYLNCYTNDGKWNEPDIKSRELLNNEFKFLGVNTKDIPDMMKFYLEKRRQTFISQSPNQNQTKNDKIYLNENQCETIKKKFDNSGYQTNYNSTETYTITFTNHTSIMNRSKITSIDIILDEFGFVGIKFYINSSEMSKLFCIYTIDDNGELKYVNYYSDDGKTHESYIKTSQGLLNYEFKFLGVSTKELPDMMKFYLEKYEKTNSKHYDKNP